MSHWVTGHQCFPLFSLSQSQTTCNHRQSKTAWRGHSSNAYCCILTILPVVNQQLYVNPATQVSVHSPVDPSPAKSGARLWLWFLSVTCVHLNYCLCVMQGKNRHAMRSGCALWLIVKCCPGALCQTPLNGLHSRKQSVAVTKGLVGTDLVMIDLHWNSEDVSENWVSPELCSGQQECPQTGMCGTALETLHKMTENSFFSLSLNFFCLENMTPRCV